jgi:hypothetical protein
MVANRRRLAISIKLEISRILQLNRNSYTLGSDTVKGLDWQYRALAHPIASVG